MFAGFGNATNRTADVTLACAVLLPFMRMLFCFHVLKVQATGAVVRSVQGLNNEAAVYFADVTAP